METKFYTVEQIAEMLNIHPKTIQRYIREGKLRATKIGKAWRVSGHDLSCFTEGFETEYQPSVEIYKEERIKASSVIDIKVTGRDEANRISNALTASMNNKPIEYGQASLHVQYIEMDQMLRLTLWGNAQFMEGMFGFVQMYFGQE